MCLVGENSLDTIMVHLRPFYPPRKQPRVEVKGKVCLVKQYLVKFGAISIGSVNRGIVVEVCVCVCVCVSVCGVCVCVCVVCACACACV